MKMIGGYILYGVGMLINVYYFAMLYYIISSWIPALQANAIGRFVEKIVEPYLAIFRKFIPPFGMIDLSPIVAFFVYNFLSGYLYDGVRSVLMMTGL